MTIHRARRRSQPPQALGGPQPLPPVRHAVGRYMTPSPHSIDKEQLVERAHQMMREHHIRHLPVLDRGKLAGIVSQRDLYFVEALAQGDASEVRVEEAMTTDAYCVTPDTPVEEVAIEMADRKYGCAVVMERGKVVGVFTTTDALNVLSTLAHRTTASP